jgi:NADPH2:quinone reductase
MSNASSPRPLCRRKRPSLTPAVKRSAWENVTALITSGAVAPLVARTYPLEQATEALRHLHEDRPFGKVILAL